VDLRAGAKFCDECGTPASETVAGPQPPAAVLQSRKDVTIVFADLSGSTTLAERMDPEAVRSVMDEYYAAIRRVVEERHGRVVKFIGDGVMAVFGVPETNEDDARRALEAALAMHVAFAEWVAQVVVDRGVEVSLRVGVNTGEVIVSAGDDDVVGDVVNVASRLEHAAEYGTVLVGEATWRLARGYGRFGEVQTLSVAGRADPVHARRLVAIVDAAPQPDGPEFVGRTHELDQLRHAFDDVAATGTARLVTVLGSPGVGKTRLAAEFQRSVDDRATVLVARCAPAAAATLAPVAELLRGATGVTGVTDGAAALQAMNALVPADEAERERIVASAAALLGAAPRGTPEETLWGVRRLLEVAARSRPVVVVIDDLHWAEPMLLDLVDHLAEWTRAPVMLMVVARPELRDVRASMVDAGRHVVIALEGLDGDATARLACGLLATDALPLGLLDRLPESTGGNPLFLRELLRMLVDDDVLRSEGGAWQLSVASEAIDVPPTIQSLLAARLDRLPRDEQTLLEHASIAGKEFPLGALHELAASAQPRSAIDALLESLRRKELVEPDGTYWIDEPVYRFHHVLIRDAAYRRVLRQTRADLHEHLAQWLQQKLGASVDEHRELVGHHLEQAYGQRRELGGLDAHGRDIGREAAAHLFTAADKALDREDLPAAAALAARTLRCLPFDDPTRADVLLVRCDALLAMGEATAAADAVAELARLSGRSPRLAAWCVCFDAQLTTMTDPSRLRDTEQRVAAIGEELDRLGDARGAAKAHTIHATTLARLGRFADVEIALDLAITRARDAGDRRFATAALSPAPSAQVWGPNPVPRAGGRCLDVVRLLRITAGSPSVEATSQRCQGLLEAFRGRAAAARRLLAAARATLEELGLAPSLLETELFAGVVELVSGDLDTARLHLRIAHDGMRALGLDADAARAAALLARASFDAGAYDEAAAFAIEARHLAGDDLESGIAWRGVQAEIDARAGRHADALALAQEAVGIAAGTDALVHHADACLALAAVRRAAGDERGAEQAARDAENLYERKGATALVERARVFSGGELGAPTRPVSSTVTREPTNRCAEVFKRLMEATEARDWEAAAALVTPDYVYDDARAVVGVGAQSGEEAGQALRVMEELGIERFVPTCVATRGDRLALFVVSAEGLVFGEGSLDGTANYDLVETTVGARLSGTKVFDLDDLESAVDELNARYLAGEGAEHAEILRAVFASNHAYNRQDWQAVRSYYAPGSTSVDHRPAGQGTLTGIDAQVDLAQAWSDIVPGVRMTIEAIHAVSEHAVVYSIGGAGVEATGGRVELAFHLLERRDDDQHITAMEIFPVGALDAALSVFRGERALELDNLCLQMSARGSDLMQRRKWDQLAVLYADDVVFDDRRAGMRAVTRGRDLLVAKVRAIMDTGSFEVLDTPIAVRGDRGALFRRRFASPGYEVDLWVVSEVDEGGTLRAVVTFDLDDLDAAFAELDARYLAGEAAPHADVYGTCARIVDLVNTRDWDGMLALWSDDLVVVDHRPGSFGVIEDRNQYLRLVQGLLDLAPDAVVRRLAIHRLDAHGCVALVRNAGASVDGGAIEIVFLYVLIVRSDHIARVEQFPVHALEPALQRFDELKRTSAGTLENLCIRTMRRSTELALAQDWEKAAAYWADDIVFDDRRPGVRMVATGRDTMLANTTAIHEAGSFDLVSTTLAIRGERCALVREQFSSAAYEVELFNVLEVDDRGTLRAIVIFDVDDLDGAVAELEDRYLAGEGAPFAPVIRMHVAGAEAFNRRDWDALGALDSPNLEIVDHRVAQFGMYDGRDDFIADIPALIELTPDLRTLIAAIYPDHHGAVVLVHNTATTEDGGQIENWMLSVGVMQNGVSTRVEYFPEDELDAARARLRALAPSTFVLDNLAVRNQRRLNELGDAENRAGMEPPVARDMQLIDKRRGLRTVTSGRDEYMRNVPAMRELGLRDHAVEFLAVRGERLALIRQVYSGDDFEAGGLTVNEVDEGGMCQAIVVFDLDDLHGAVAELDARYLAGEGAPFAPVVRVNTAVVTATNQRDWDALSALHAPGVEFIDHRRGRFGLFDGRNDFFEDLAAMTEVVADTWITTIAFAAAPHGYVSLTHFTSTSDDGGQFEEPFVYLAIVEDGVVTRGEYFDEGDFEAARARLAELAPDRHMTVPSNRAYEVSRVSHGALIDRDRAGHEATFAGGYRIDDRRSFLRLENEDRTPEGIRQEATGGAFTLIATRGERLALQRSVLRGQTKDGFEWESGALVLTEIDDEDLVIEAVTFDDDDLDAAVAELDARYLAGEGAPFAQVFQVSMASDAAVNRHDWEALRALHAPGVEFVDHRRGRFGLYDARDDLLGDIPAMTDVAPDGRTMALAVHPAPHGIVVLLHTESTSDDGGHLEEPLVYLVIIEDGLITRGELFDDTDLEAARARLAELAPE
jgi:class 3 adenylate cyclase